MADVTERMLALLSTLQTGRSFPGDQLAQRLGVSQRTLRRDVARLRGYGYPVDTQPGPGGHYRLSAGRTMPPLVLDDDEAVATLLGLAALASTGSAHDGALDEAATRAYGKLDQFLPARLRPRVSAVRASLETSLQPAPAVDATVLGLIAEAIGRQHIIAFTYTDREGRSSRRRVEPHRHIHHLLRWYLLAWDTERTDWRIFRLDRITEPLPTEATFEQRPLPDGSAVDYLRAGIERNRQRVTIFVEAPIQQVSEALLYQDAELTPVHDKGTAVTLAVESWPWLILHLARLDAEFTISAAPDLHDACHNFATRLLTAVAQSPAHEP